MTDMYGLVGARMLLPTEKITWEELAEQWERPSRLWRTLGTLASLVTLGARIRRARELPDLCGSPERASECQVPA